MAGPLLAGLLAQVHVTVTLSSKMHNLFLIEYKKYLNAHNLKIAKLV